MSGRIQFAETILAHILTEAEGEARKGIRILGTGR